MGSVTTNWRKAATARLCRVSRFISRKSLAYALRHSVDRGMQGRTFLCIGMLPRCDYEEKSSSDSRCASQWPLEGDPNVTSVAGEVRKLSDQPLEGVTLRIDEQTARTDETGRFLLISVSLDIISC